MIFSELIKQMQVERCLKCAQLAEELGISYPYMKKLRDGTVKLPNKETIDKLYQYCNRNNIDFEIDWNDVLYDILANSAKSKDYEWMDDLDSSGCVAIKHKFCGRITRVPILAFKGNGELCLWCSFHPYISGGKYTVNLFERSGWCKFVHNKCGYTYYVSYENIKRKKHGCPRCDWLRYNVADDITVPPTKDKKHIWR